jgi:ABC-type lipoprotein release transport system permease subunit
VHSSLGLKPGQKVVLLGREFTIARLHGERGTKDDITVFMHLKEAQELLGKEGRINGIHALECSCAWADIDKVRAEIGKVLPETQIIEFDASKALARAEGRYRAAEEAEAAVGSLVSHRQALRREREAFAGRLIPAVVLLAGVWLALLTFSNVKDRQYEIALLRSLGLGVAGVMRIFLAKAVVLGAAGALVGTFAGVAAGLIGLLREGGLTGAVFASFVEATPVVTIVAVAAALAAVAAWPPALYGCQKDPAEILSQE